MLRYSSCEVGQLALSGQSHLTPGDLSLFLLIFIIFKIKPVFTLAYSLTLKNSVWEEKMKAQPTH